MTVTVKADLAGLDLSSFDMVSFDCYGTLIDWETGILNAVRPVFAARGVPADDAAILAGYAAAEARFESGPYMRYRDVLAATFSALATGAGFTARAEEARRFAATLADWAPFSDTIPALRMLGRAHRLAVLSNVDRDLFTATARALGDPFDLVVTAEDVGSYKPSRANFEALLHRSAVPAGRLLHVAESLYHDVAPAGALGIRTIWVNRRGGPPGRGATPAAPARPDFEVRTLAALAELC